MNSVIVNEYQPDVVSPPGETLQEILDELRMTQAELAERTGRPKKTINEIVKGKAAITPETALQLERALGVPAEFWNARERSFRENLARRQEEKELSRFTDWLETMPQRELIKRGWIRKQKDEVGRVREMLSYFGVSSPEQWRTVFEQPQAAFRLSASFETDPGALSAWLRKGDIEAQRIRCRNYDEKIFLEELAEIRGLTSEDPLVAIRGAQDRFARAGVALVIVPHLKQCPVQGAARWLAPSKAILQLSLRYKRDDIFWFGLFHEAGHLLLHGKRLTFIDEKLGGKGKPEEEADRFAASQLVPDEDIEFIRTLAHMKNLHSATIEATASELGIAPSIIVGRLQHEGLVPQSHHSGLRKPLDEKAILESLESQD